MNSSPLHSLATKPVSSSAISQQKIAASPQSSMDFSPLDGTPGSYDDAGVIRGVLLQSMDRSGLSRDSIADRMSYLLARQVTATMLNAFTAESRNDRRWPAEFDRAFCEATGDNTLLRCRAERAGLHVITGQQVQLLELGRHYLAQKRAAAAIAKLEAELAEVAL